MVTEYRQIRKCTHTVRTLEPSDIFRNFPVRRQQVLINSSSLSDRLTACTKVASTGGVLLKFGVGEF